MPTVQAIDGAPQRDVCGSDAAVEELRGPLGHCAAAVVMPGPGVDLPRTTARNVPSCAIVRLASGPVWMIRVVGYWWSAQRLAAASSVLQEHGHCADPITLNDRLCDELELPGVSASLPGPADLDGSTWEVRRVVVAIQLARAFSQAPAHPSPLTSAEIAATVQCIEEQLATALRRFQLGMDCEVMRVAARYAGVSLSVYNYLAHTDHRRNRLQAAAVLPLFLRCLAMRGDAAPFRQMSLAIDHGRPLIDAACAALRVSPSAVRCLIGREASVCGETWEDAPDALVRLLDSVRPEARPGPDPQSWTRLRELVAFAESRLDRPIAESFFGRTWVREVLQSGAGAARRRADSLFDSRSVTAVESLRDELIRMIELGSRAAGRPRSTVRDEAVKDSVDALLGARTLRRLITTGLQWQQEYAGARTERDDLMEFLRGVRYWPLLPAAHETADRSRRIVPLTSRAQLQEHGAVMGICLAGSHLLAYDAACRKGRAFVLAVLDGVTGQRLSTVELKVSRPGRNAAMVVSVVQHTGHANSSPSQACRTALRELAPVFAGEAVQRHLRMGLMALGAFRAHAVEPGDRADLLARIRALRRTLGDEAYDALLRAHAGAPAVASGLPDRTSQRPGALAARLLPPGPTRLHGPQVGAPA